MVVSQHLICAIDIATSCGVCYGVPDDSEPTIGSVRFGSDGANADAVFCAALTWSQRFFAEHKFSSVAIEKMLPPEAMPGRTSRQVRDRLAGLQGIIRGAARAAGIFSIVVIDVGDVRSHFIGMRGGKREAAKLQVMQRCKLLGWPVENSDEADAAALWSFEASRLNPKLALRVSPLFGPKGVAL